MTIKTPSYARLRQYLHVARNALEPIDKMNYDFFANKSDKASLLNFIFDQTDLKMFDLSSPFGEEIGEYKSTSEIESKFDLEHGGQFSLTFQMWTRRFGADLFFRKVELDPKYCDGHTFRYSTDGWGLIQLYFGGLKENVLSHSHLGHLTEKRALKWQDANLLNGRVDRWNWTEIKHTSMQLKNYLHKSLAVRNVGAYGVLPGADNLSKSGIQLWGT